MAGHAASQVGGLAVARFAQVSAESTCCLRRARGAYGRSCQSRCLRDQGGHGSSELTLRPRAPQDSPDLLLLLRLLALGQGAWDMIDSQVFKEPKMVMGLGWGHFYPFFPGAMGP